MMRDFGSTAPLDKSSIQLMSADVSVLAASHKSGQFSFEDSERRGILCFCFS
jgi:hypothetical protein